MKISLDTLQPGQGAWVTALNCPDDLRRRLADFGLVPDTWVRCRYRSPGRDLSALELRGTVLAVRSTDLAQIIGRRL